MKVKYIGPQIGSVGLDDGGIYEVLEVDPLSGGFRIVDESGEDYLYSPTSPRPLSGDQKAGRFEVVEDDEKGTLAKAIKGEWPS